MRDRDGTLDLARLHGLAQRFGVRNWALHAMLRPDEQYRFIGALLRDREIGPPSMARPPLAAMGSTAASGATLECRPSEEPFHEGPIRSTLRPALVTQASVAGLLALFGQVMDELRDRAVTRSANAPGGDYAEFLCARAFGWRLLANSARSVDAVDAQGRRYQIKSRRLTGANGERQLGALRGLADASFDTLAGVLFGPDFSVVKAALIPHAVVVREASFAAHTNAHRFILDDAVWAMRGVRDVTAELATTARQI